MQLRPTCKWGCFSSNFWGDEWKRCSSKCRNKKKNRNL